MCYIILPVDSGAYREKFWFCTNASMMAYLIRTAFIDARFIRAWAPFSGRCLFTPESSRCGTYLRPGAT